MFSEPARRSLLAAAWIALALMAANCAQAAATTASSRQNAPVAHVADQAMRVRTPDGDGTLPLYADRNIDAAEPDVTRVFIIVHGTLRNADKYFATGQQVLAAAGSDAARSMIVAPHFLTTRDLRAFPMPESTLAWSEAGWKEGAPARRPASVSSFAALDALLEHCDDRQRYPALSSVTVIGHSAGAQVVQRLPWPDARRKRWRATESACGTWSRIRRAICISMMNVPCRAVFSSTSIRRPVRALSNGNTAWSIHPLMSPRRTRRKSRPATRSAMSCICLAWMTWTRARTLSTAPVRRWHKVRSGSRAGLRTSIICEAGIPSG